MKRFIVFGLLISMILTACSVFAPQVEDGIVEDGQVKIYALDG